MQHNNCSTNVKKDLREDKLPGSLFMNEGRATLIADVFLQSFFFFAGFNKAQNYEYCVVFCKDYFLQHLAITFLFAKSCYDHR